MDNLKSVLKDLQTYLDNAQGLKSDFRPYSSEWQNVIWIHSILQRLLSFAMDETDMTLAQECLKFIEIYQAHLKQDILQVLKSESPGELPIEDEHLQGLLERIDFGHLNTSRIDGLNSEVLTKVQNIYNTLIVKSEDHDE